MNQYNDKMNDLLRSLYGQQLPPNTDMQQNWGQAIPASNYQKPTKLVDDIKAHPENIVDAEFEIINGEKE